MLFVQAGAGYCLLLQPPPQASEAASQTNMGPGREGLGKHTLPPKSGEERKKPPAPSRDGSEGGQASRKDLVSASRLEQKGVGMPPMGPVTLEPRHTEASTLAVRRAHLRALSMPCWGWEHSQCNCVLTLWGGGLTRRPYGSNRDSAYDNRCVMWTKLSSNWTHRARPALKAHSPHRAAD